MQPPIVTIQNSPTESTQEEEAALPFGELHGHTERCLILSMRHFGDAVICAGFIRRLQLANPAMQIDVLGRPGHEEIFRYLCNIDRYLEFDIPVFRHHARSAESLLRTSQSLYKVRRSRYEFCINLIGDTREDAIGRLTGATWNITPAWSPGHLFRNKITHKSSIFLANCAIRIPVRYRSYYDSIGYFAQRMGLSDQACPQRTSSSDEMNRQANPVVALHPGASHPSRRWLPAKWKQLIKRLAHRGYHLKLMGAPSESTSLRDDFRDEIDRFSITLVAVDFGSFFSSLSTTDALIGMDSFSAHAAHILGVPSVVLNGSSDTVIMTPPKSIALTAGHLCQSYPCDYQYPCIHTEKEFICCREIDVTEVINALDRILA